jgi:hypothetical protein
MWRSDGPISAVGVHLSVASVNACLDSPPVHVSASEPSGRTDSPAADGALCSEEWLPANDGVSKGISASRTGSLMAESFTR